MTNEQFEARNTDHFPTSRGLEVTDEGLEVTEVNYFEHEKHRLVGAINAALEFAGSFTDLLICEGEPVTIKSAQGVVGLSEMNILGTDMVATKEDIRNFFCHFLGEQPLTTNAQDYWEENVSPVLKEHGSVSRSACTPNGEYLRVSLFQQKRGRISMVIRVTRPPQELDSLGLPTVLLKRLKVNPRGLLVITGPTASGKTSTALSILDWLNKNTASHIVTVEDPIEYPMERELSVFTQREVGTDVDTFAAGLRDAMRHSPDAILASEVRDRESAEAAIFGGESGALMIVTTHGRSITGTLRKLLALTGDQAGAMRSVMAWSLMGVVRQDLAPHSNGKGYSMVCDVLIPGEQVRQRIEDGDWRKLEKQLQGGVPSDEFFPMSEMVNDLARRRIIDPVVAVAILKGVG